MTASRYSQIKRNREREKTEPMRYTQQAWPRRGFACC